MAEGVGEMDSAVKWSEVRDSFDYYHVKLGPAVAQAYVNDPRMIGFICARYKFVAKMLSGKSRVLEIGCGEMFGAPIVAQEVEKLICTDVTAGLGTIAPRSIDWQIWDFRTREFPSPVDAAFMIDVIEHVYPDEEHWFLSNVINSLTFHGVLLIGTPNATAEQYASEFSRKAHVNLKTAEQLREMGQHWFHNVFMFSMNDEVVHTGFAPMAHYLFMMGVGPRR